jgi:hypothetical protein
VQLTAGVWVELVPISDYWKYSARIKKIYQAVLHHKLPTGRPNARWKDGAENYMKDIWALLIGDK